MEADMSKPWRVSNGCGRNREVQSIRFLIVPGMEPLYSGDEMMKASFASSRLRNSGKRWRP
jgi:hypothetical protein